jgi:1,4-dihydroxy-2-naphthoate octaprenyltransferase
MVGMFGGFFYSTRPLRWVSTGLGELWIAFCYGWLPVATSCYLQMGSFPSLVAYVSIPIGLTIFNVILLNEFPDYPADKAAGKRNLSVRLGLEVAAYLYGLASVGSWFTFLFSLSRGVPLQSLWAYVPVMLVSVVLVVMLVRGRWRDPAALEKLCGGTLVVNLGTTGAYILAFLV